MKDERILVIVLFASYMVRDAWQLYPIDPDTLCLGSPCAYDIHPFPFSSQGIAKSTYCWLIGLYTAQFLWCFIPRALVKRTKPVFTCALVLAACELAECLINYNEPWSYIIGVPLNITSLRYVFFSYFALPTFYLWRN